MHIHKRGFTIVEIITIIAIIGILASIAVVSYSSIQSGAITSLAETMLRDFSLKAKLYAKDTGGTYPLTTDNLEALNFKVNRTGLATSPTVDSNVLYCTANGGANYVMMVYAANNKMYYITNTSEGEYTGSSNWNANNYGGRCSNVLPGSASNSYSGYNTNHPGDKWADWTK